MKLPVIVDVKKGTVIVQEKTGNPGDALLVVAKDIQEQFAPGQNKFPYSRYGKNAFSSYRLVHKTVTFVYEGKNVKYFEHIIDCHFD